jgi:CRISPR-associated protein Cmr6
LDYDVKHVIISNKSRLTIMRSGGTGEVIYEIGLSLHPILGIPYVPSSSIKGSYRNALYELLTEMVGENSSTAITKLIFGEKLRKEEKRILMSIFQKNESLEQYFDGHLSWIEFFDAYPYTYGANNYLIIPDVMTPHYKGDVKTEFDVSPTPLIHLVIPEGIKFRVVFAYNKKYLSKIFDQLFRDNKYAKKIDLEEILLDTLKVAGFLGIGGRTSLGYSSFEVVQDES